MIYVITNGEQYIRTNPNGRLAWSGNPTLANSFETFPAALGFLKTKRVQNFLKGNSRRSRVVELTDGYMPVEKPENCCEENLNDVDVIFSEDTRVTLNLLNYLGINKKLIALHEHNEDMAKEKVLEYLKNGNNVALVTDRGTPIISDPGYKTVKYITDNNYNVVALPGHTAFVPALITSGLAPQPFLFYGFLDSKDSLKRSELERLSDEEETIIFYEAPHRIIRTLNMMLDIFGDRNISISREISKKFETIYRGKISDVINIIPEKGEFVIIVDGVKDKIVDNNITIKNAVDNYIRTGFDVMTSIKKVAKDRNVPKNVIYKEYHKEDN